MYLRLADWYGVGEWNIQHLPFGLILKHTHNRPPEIEANNIKFIHKNTSIPVPRVLDVLPDIPTGTKLPDGLILMTKVEGVTLQDWLWARTKYPPEFHRYLALLEGPPQMQGKQSLKEISEILRTFELVLDLSDGAQLIDDLKRAFTELRSILPPSGEVSGLHSLPFIYMRYTDRRVLQPFKGIRAFHDMLLSDVSWESCIPRLQQLASPVYDKPHRLCFSHCDLTKTNIIASEDGRLAAIVDWETAGWFPEYWEFTMMERQSMGSEVMQTFWNAVGVLGNGLYDKELQLEQALWRSTGIMSVPPGVVPDDPLDVLLVAPCDLI
ncbi:hypothetical protein ARMSODRAFT_109688 [Armillaria solidipes]|uniref:Aminoglycoside phosphotransferase domain-containing protein n=1 Tax=Armillaria solidipes TaxID=1076256 RepID=A0A2H3BHL1_9AGAR|nr:hypothetical protein ARMSODRAFT_109688 [Armillaria solidipes]